MLSVAPLSDLSAEFGLALAIALGLLATALIGLVGSGRSGRRRDRRAVERPVRDARWRAVEEARLRAEAASEAKSRFLATVSHEFRTPLNGILGMAALLRDTPLSAEQLTYVDAVTGSAEAFLSLVEEILDFSRIEAGHIDLVEAPFAPEALVQGVTELLAPRAQGKGIEIACFVERDVPDLVIGDRDRLRQVLFNLAGNAVKFTQDGGVGITVRRAPGGLSITVDDTGPGIEPDRIGRIFDEFEAGPSPDSGTGLGLAITRRILARMGGAIRVESTPGEGSRFEVSLPLAQAPDRPTTRLPDFAGVSVLILGPSPFELAFLSRRLLEGGARVLRALTLAEAAAALERERFDVFLVDAAIGDERAREMAGLARRAGVGRAIVLVSPFERREFGPPGAAGFDAYLIKPVRARSLAERLLGAMPAPVATDQDAPAAPAHRPTGRLVRVLLAEDNDVNALVALKALEKLGAVVDWARDGREALAKAKSAMAGETLAYDAILMDVRMPGLDGMEATRRIRAGEARQGASPTRIIALTASVVDMDDERARALGFDGFLPKPFDLAQLRRQVLGEAPLARVG